MNQRVRLTGVQGDQEEYADLIGTEGELRKLSDGTNFLPDGRGDWLTMKVKRRVEKEGKVVISTHLGNRFTFKILPEKAKLGALAGS